MSRPLLEVRDLTAGFRQGTRWSPAVDGVSFQISPGETFALVGESGSGKSVTALSVLRLLPPNGSITKGRILLDGQDLLRVPEIAMGSVRGRRIGVIFQDPQTALNPVMTVGRQVEEVVIRHSRCARRMARARALDLLGQVALPEPDRLYRDYPHRLSGGMRQRVMIAIALAGQPDLLIADEPTTALDVTVQSQILDLLKSLLKEHGMALWLITHDLGIVAELADRIAVMQNGRIVESAASEAFFKQPEHPYSQRLLALLPRISACRTRSVAKTDEPSLLLEVRGLEVYFPIKRGLLQRTVGHVRAVDGVSFDIPVGRTLAVVGESGCGKTSLGKALLRLLPTHGGDIRYHGETATSLEGHALMRFRAAVQIIFQDPYSSMNPRLLVGDIVSEGLNTLVPGLDAEVSRARVERLLEAVGLPPAARLRYPHEFSGGQRQRICIARALAVEPRLIVCDEPTSALDVSVQAQILELLVELQTRLGLSYLFITHDLGVVAEMAHEVAVMHRGRIVEQGRTATVLQAPSHPYTQQLLHAVPRLRRA